MDLSRGLGDVYKRQVQVSTGGTVYCKPINRN
jgi:hypothetical protein